MNSTGESVDDCGGGYSESIAEMCEELQNGSLPLLILTPNGREEAGTNRDCFILNPSANSGQNLKMFQFLGVLMGIAIRTGSPLSLNLAEPTWKALVHFKLTKLTTTTKTNEMRMNSIESSRIAGWFASQFD